MSVPRQELGLEAQVARGSTEELVLVHKDASFYAKITLWEWLIYWHSFEIGRVSVRFVINWNVTQRRASPYLRHDKSLAGVQLMTSQNPGQWRALFWVRLEMFHVRMEAPRSCGRVGTPQCHQEWSLALEFVLFSWIGIFFPCQWPFN